MKKQQSKKWKDTKNKDEINRKIKRLNSIKGLLISLKLNQALSEINDYLEDYPNDEFGRLCYGKILAKLQNYSEAKKVFNELVLELKN